MEGTPVTAPDAPLETGAQRLARIATSPAAQAVVDQAPTMTRRQLATVRPIVQGARGQRPATDVPHVVYVGMTRDFEKRRRAHELHAPWYRFVAHRTVEDAESEDAARAVEAEAIKTEQPVFNGTRPGAGHAERRAAYLGETALGATTSAPAAAPASVPAAGHHPGASHGRTAP